MRNVGPPCPTRRPRSMRPPTTFRFLLVLAAAIVALPAAAYEKTVCTITVNSADEKDAFRRHLPADKYRFVELVERGRPDWLASACKTRRALRRPRDLRPLRRRQRVLFRSARGARVPAGRRNGARLLQRFVPGPLLAAEGGLPVRLQHAEPGGDCAARRPRSCAASCAPDMRAPTPSGSRASLNAGHGESSRDRMRLVFKDVPAIYGFSSVAPLGPEAAATARHSYFQANGTGEVGTGRVNSRLLGQFSRELDGRDPRDDATPIRTPRIRRDVCQFADERLSRRADGSRFVHQLLQRRDGRSAGCSSTGSKRYAATLDDARPEGAGRVAGARARSRATARRATAISTSRAMPISRAVRVRMLDARAEARLALAGASCAPSSCG